MRDQLRAGDGEQRHPQRREHPGQRRLCAGLVAQPRAGERARREITGEPRADHVRQALGADFLVGVDQLLGADRQRAGDGQAGDQAKHAHRHGAWQQAQDQLQVPQRQRAQRWQLAGEGRHQGHMVEHRRPEQGQQRGPEQTYQQRRPARQQQLDGEADDQRAQAQQQRWPVGFSGVGQQVFQGSQRRGLALQFQPHQARQLAQGDDHGGAAGKADHHRVGDEIDQRAEAQHAQQPLEHAAEKGQQEDQADVVAAARHGHGADGGVEDDGDGRRGPADEVPGRTPQAGDQHRHDGRVQPVLGRQAGDQGVGDGLRQGQDRAAEAHQQVAAYAAASLPGQPAQEGQQSVAVGPGHGVALSPVEACQGGGSGSPLQAGRAQSVAFTAARASPPSRVFTPCSQPSSTPGLARIQALAASS